ncbi:hypothetical protein [Burkholderia ubonensis]|uniref:hypothetical protein n=1 Tax=Burkholderia ubonensis TaxID=101571 RepID=UPI00076CDBB2|nr:hypothetical protein [Burkholderia ubonensis]KVP75556.1 hypothetical protein WJ93_09360 [Burkholderia ubonensis]
MATNQSTRQLVLDAVRAAGRPIDAYQVAKVTGLTPMQAGRTLVKLAAEQLIVTSDPLDAADGGLAAQFRAS